MQTIKHKSGFTYFSQLLYDIDTLYAITSDCKQWLSLFPHTLDSSLKPIFDLFTENSNCEFEQPVFEEFHYNKHKVKYDPKNIIVCYSGGKDSLSVILHYKKMGYNVYAYHIRGLNKGYYDEWAMAEQASREIGFNLVIDEVSYSGQHLWTEHPMKNMLMATMALNYGVTHGITTKIAVGDFRGCRLENVSFFVTGGDTIDLWRMYEKVIRRIIPNFRVYIPNKDYFTAYNMLIHNPQYIQYTMSCMTPNRFRDLFKNRTQKNYGVDLLPSRCGCCSKCAVEYIVFCDNNIFKLNKSYYLHCLEILAYTSLKEDNNEALSLSHVWSLYFYYPMSKSKL